MLLVEEAAPGFQVSPEPVESLTPQTAAFLLVEAGRVLALAAAGQGGGARSVVTAGGRKVVGQGRLGGKGFGIPARGGAELLARTLAETGQRQALGGILG